MTYLQRSPYQTTVTQQPVVVVPLVSGPSAIITRRNPAHIRNGAKVGGQIVGARCICCMCVFGVIMFAMGALTLMITHNLGISLPPTSIYGIILVLLGAPFLFISAYLSGIYKRKYNRQQSQENTAPSSEAFINGRNTSGHIHSRQRQSAVRQPIAAIAPSVYDYEPVLSPSTAPSVYDYEPVLSPSTAPPAYDYEPLLSSVPPSTQHPNQNTDGVAYPGPPSYSAPEMIQVPEGIPITSSSVSHSAEISSEQQTFQPRIDTFSAVVADSQAPYTELEMALAQVYEQHPANAPPEYSP